MQNPFLKIIFVLCFPFCLNGQAIYNGHVQDVVTRGNIYDAKVELLHSSIESSSNFYGDFLIKNVEQDSLVPSLNTYRFYNNSIIWEGEFDISVEIFATDGRLVVNAANLGNSGSYLFPSFPFGIYLLRIATNDEMQSFKVFSNGQSTTIVDKGAVWHHSSVPLRADTLLISKEHESSRILGFGIKKAFCVTLMDYHNLQNAQKAYVFKTTAR